MSGILDISNLTYSEFELYLLNHENEEFRQIGTMLEKYAEEGFEGCAVGLREIEEAENKLESLQNDFEDYKDRSELKVNRLKKENKELTERLENALLLASSISNGKLIDPELPFRRKVRISFESMLRRNHPDLWNLYQVLYEGRHE